jgi:peroxiredoxin
LIAISPQLVEKNRTLKDKLRLKFEILRDPGNEVGAAFGLKWAFPEDLKQLYLQFGLDLPAGTGDDSWTLALPAGYVIDKEGMVRFAHTDPDYTRRPEPEEPPKALRTIE